jgi:hypothetical protein
MNNFWLAFVIIISLVAPIIIVYALWKSLSNISDVMTDIRHGKGVFLTFKYTAEEWEYYEQTLPFTGNNGKVCFAQNHIYLTDGAEEILYELSGDLGVSAWLRNVCVENEFLVFTVRTQDLARKINFDTGEYVERKPDSPDNLWQYQILIPLAQKDKTDEIINFYQKTIDNINARLLAE